MKLQQGCTLTWLLVYHVSEHITAEQWKVNQDYSHSSSLLPISTSGKRVYSIINTKNFAIEFRDFSARLIYVEKLASMSLEYRCM